MANTYLDLFLAYGAFWVLIFIFVCVLFKEQRNTKRMLDSYNNGEYGSCNCGNYDRGDI